MDKNAIKKYAVWARNELIARITQKAEQYEITEKKTTPKDADSIGGRLLTETEKNQRKALIEKIHADGFEQVMEEVAYTWFNRFTALRFMEVNNYLPSHTRVFTNEAGEFKPQILADAIQLDLEGLNMDKVFELKDANKTEELYKYLLITQCNALSGILPRMFQKIEHYTELLLPDYLLREGSVIEQMIALIPEEDWTDQVQIIGWLYQYYNSEPKDAVFAALKKNVKISKENIPAATQLFTPDWIVRYMVENSLGRLWLEGHPNDTLKSEWKYYLDEAEQEENVQKQLNAIRKEYATLKPEEIRCIDPCMGSGHILCYMFDVLVKIYEDYGYTAREAVEDIITKNLWGLDIDERAAQLSYFAVMMKARQYDRRFFSKKDENGELCIPQPHVYAIEESNGITSAPMHDMGIGLSQEEYGKAVKEAMRLVDEMRDAKEYGSLIRVSPCDWNLLCRFAVPRGFSEGQMRIDIHGEIAASERLQILINIGEALSQRYDVVVTNPPYMGSQNMGNDLLEYIKKNHPDSKADIYAAFIERNFVFSKRYVSMITQSTWMFQSRFESIRNNLYQKLLVCMNHLGTRAFDEISGEVVQTTAFCYLNQGYLKNYKTAFVKLVDYFGEQAKENAFFESKNRNYRNVGKFKAIPGAPFAHYISDIAIEDFEKGTALKNKLVPKQGTSTGDDETFVRYWFEINYPDIGFGFSSTEEAHKSNLKYFPLDKGGEFRKWYGNNDRVIMFDPVSYSKLLDMGNHLPSRQFYFAEGLTWSKIASELSVRYSPKGFVFSSVGLKGFPATENAKYILAFMNSNVCRYFVKVISPGMSIVSGDIEKLPFIHVSDDRIDELCGENIEVSRTDWDSFEYSWDFKRHPLVPLAKELQEQQDSQFSASRMQKFGLVSWHYSQWESACKERFSILKRNEEELNRIFMEIYGLSDELTDAVDNKDISVCEANLQREIKSLISYAVGCMFGRYSLDYPGLVYAGGDWDQSKYISFIPDKDGIIPICNDDYFEDDITGRFVKFIECAYGKNTLEENLRFIADALGGKGTSREVIRNYFLNDFYSDHIKNYQKKPFYWLFSSGNKGGFKCLVYMHRYKPDMIARIRTDYVHEQQSRYRTALENLEQRVEGAATSERVNLTRQLQKLQEQSIEIREYEEKVHHFADQMIHIDIEKGVKKNYEIFKDILEKLK